MAGYTSDTMKALLNDQLRNVFALHDEIRLVLLFGSVARGAEQATSDVDIGIAADKPLSAELRKALIGEIADVSGRPVDIVDLRTAGMPVLEQVLTKGTVLICKDHTLHAELIKRMWFDRADFGPMRDRILQERRDAWIGKS